MFRIARKASLDHTPRVAHSLNVDLYQRRRRARALQSQDQKGSKREMHELIVYQPSCRCANVNSAAMS
jgi:hypothetical protein